MLWIIGLVGITLAGALLVQDRAHAVVAGQGIARARGHRIRGDLAAAACVGGGLVLTVAVAGARGYGNGRLVACLPALVGGCLLAVFTGVESTWPRPRGSIRTASVHARRLPDLGAHRLVALVGTWAVALVLALTCFAVVASGPRQVTRGLAGGRELVVSPFPGWWYGVPVVLAVAVLVGWTWGVLHLILARPAVPGLAEEEDLELRRRSARRALAGTQLAMSLTLASQLAVAALALRALGLGEGGTGSVALAAPTSSAYVGLAVALGVMAALVTLIGVVACFLPTRSTQRGAPTRTAMVAP